MSRRSKSIKINFVAVVASAALSGCNSDQSYHRDWQQCVDKNNMQVGIDHYFIAANHENAPFDQF
jgi:hypothetical protein